MAEPLQSTSAESRVRILSQRDVNAPPSTVDHVSKASNQAFLTQTVAILTAIATLLAARFLLLISGVGGFVLSYMAMQSPDTSRLLVCAIYDVMIFCPLVWMYMRNP